MFKTLSLVIITLTTLMAREPEWDAAYVIKSMPNLTIAIWKNKSVIRQVAVGTDVEQSPAYEFDIPDFNYAPSLITTMADHTAPCVRLSIYDWDMREIGKVTIDREMSKEALEHQLNLAGKVYSVDPTTLTIGKILDEYLYPPYRVGDWEFLNRIPLTRKD